MGEELSQHRLKQTQRKTCCIDRASMHALMPTTRRVMAVIAWHALSDLAPAAPALSGYPRLFMEPHWARTKACDDAGHFLHNRRGSPGLRDSSCSWHERRLGPRLWPWPLRPRTNSEYAPEPRNTSTQREHEDRGAGGKEETKWSKREDKQLANPISHLIAKGNSGGGEVTHGFGLDDPARRMTCIAISTRRVTVKKHLSYETRWTWQRLPKTIPDNPEVMFFHCACAWEPDAAAVTEAMVLHSAWMLPSLALRLGAAESPVVLPVAKAQVAAAPPPSQPPESWSDVIVPGTHGQGRYYGWVITSCNQGKGIPPSIPDTVCTEAVLHFSICMMRRRVSTSSTRMRLRLPARGWCARNNATVRCLQSSSAGRNRSPRWSLFRILGTGLPMVRSMWPWHRINGRNPTSGPAYGFCFCISRSKRCLKKKITLTLGTRPSPNTFTRTTPGSPQGKASHGL